MQTDPIDRIRDRREPAAGLPRNRTRRRTPRLPGVRAAARQRRGRLAVRHAGGADRHRRQRSTGRPRVRAVDRVERAAADPERAADRDLRVALPRRAPRATAGRSRSTASARWSARWTTPGWRPLVTLAREAVTGSLLLLETEGQLPGAEPHTAVIWRRGPGRGATWSRSRGPSAGRPGRTRAGRGCGGSRGAKAALHDLGRLRAGLDSKAWDAGCLAVEAYPGWLAQQLEPGARRGGRDAPERPAAAGPRLPHLGPACTGKDPGDAPRSTRADGRAGRWT